jgi:hypothetical protein
MGFHFKFCDLSSSIMIVFLNLFFGFMIVLPSFSYYPFNNLFSFGEIIPLGFFSFSTVPNFSRIIIRVT